MSYQVYFADLTEENRSLQLGLLRFKEEAGRLEPGEEEFLAKLRADAAPTRQVEPQLEREREREPAREPAQGPRRGGSGRRRFSNGRNRNFSDP